MTAEIDALWQAYEGALGQEHPLAAVRDSQDAMKAVIDCLLVGEPVLAELLAAVLALGHEPYRSSYPGHEAVYSWFDDDGTPETLGHEASNLPSRLYQGLRQGRRLGSQKSYPDARSAWTDLCRAFAAGQAMVEAGG